MKMFEVLYVYLCHQVFHHQPWCTDDRKHPKDSLFFSCSIALLTTAERDSDKVVIRSFFMCNFFYATNV